MTLWWSNMGGLIARAAVLGVGSRGLRRVSEQQRAVLFQVGAPFVCSILADSTGQMDLNPVLEASSHAHAQ